MKVADNPAGTLRAYEYGERVQEIFRQLKNITSASLQTRKIFVHFILSNVYINIKCPETSTLPPANPDDTLKVQWRSGAIL